MSNLRKLKVLHLYGNKLEKLPLVFIDMPKLLFAFMSNNKISEIPNEFFTNDIGLMALVLTGNPLMECDKIKANKYFRKFFLLEM